MKLSAFLFESEMHMLLWCACLLRY